MARTKFKWKFALFSYLILVNVCTKSLPIATRIPSLTTTDTVFHNGEVLETHEAVITFRNNVAAIVANEELVTTTDFPSVDNSTEVTDGNFTEVLNRTRNIFSRQVRPGQQISSYAIELTVNGGNTFSGRAVIDVDLVFETREDPIILHVEDLTILSVKAGVLTVINAVDADFNLDEGLLEITPAQLATSYVLEIEYTGSLQTAGQGLYRGGYNNFDYLAMNLHPTHARRVFPCMDEDVESSIRFQFNGIEYNNLMANSLLQENSLTDFRTLNGPPHRWAMAAHNLNNINVPTSGVFLYVRPGVSNQESQASIALNFYFNTLNEWTNKPYFEIILNQATQLSILALPDVSRDWYGLSTISIWEPYILMENTCSVKQKYTAFVKMAEAMSRQWYGYVIFPQNWRYQWVVGGLASYAAYDVLREFQRDPTGIDISLLDINTLFVTEVIQESLYRDGYSSALPLDTTEDLSEEDAIRDYMNGIQKFKAPALLRMLRLILGDESQDHIKQAASILVTDRRPHLATNFNRLEDAINSVWNSDAGPINDIAEYLEPWIENNGYPLIHVGLRQNGVVVTQERFSYTSQPHVTYNVPITYTTSNNPNYDTSNIYPIEMMEGTLTLNMFLDEDDYVLFNIQGQGYYRVNYDNDLWETIIEALDDPDRRAEIHPLNRATLIDDSLNLARAGRIDYEVAFRVALTMQHETEYAPWKAFIRNMNFLKKRLIALVTEDEDLDPNIYLRMVQRTIGAFEQEIGFSPDPLLTESAMTSLTRGLVMDHACRAGYQPCIAAAVDWFYDPNNNDPVVNPNIPSDIRPAVYCAMVREGDNDVISALYNRLEIEVSMWERVVILESLACSNDDNFVRTLLEETIATNSPYTPEEKIKIFTAVAESSFGNAAVALNFISRRTNEIRNMYGGAEKLEEAIIALTENMADFGLSNDFNIWVYAQNNNLEDSQFPAERAAALAMENTGWDNNHLEYVYEWIDENDAPTLIVSLVLISVSCFMALFNH